jgi:hypothetical protein
MAWARDLSRPTQIAPRLAITPTLLLIASLALLVVRGSGSPWATTGTVAVVWLALIALGAVLMRRRR